MQTGVTSTYDQTTYTMPEKEFLERLGIESSEGVLGIRHDFITSEKNITITMRKKAAE
jgi:hypothetical protein